MGRIRLGELLGPEGPSTRTRGEREEEVRGRRDRIWKKTAGCHRRGRPGNRGMQPAGGEQTVQIMTLSSGMKGGKQGVRESSSEGESEDVCLCRGGCRKSIDML